MTNKSVTVGTGAGNKALSQIALGTALGNKTVIEGWVGTAGGNKQFWPPYPPLTISVGGSGWEVVDFYYHFGASALGSGGSGSYTYSNDQGSGQSYDLQWYSDDPPPVTVTFTVTDNVTGGTASDSFSSSPP